ncbi:MAG: HPr-rel-A system PqqD family peptide chaperone [Betaproteobacteria bacterium]|nr:MAG: HPr-rel-A system PqqD family peptide chaperone [Betaproteobacteria bacterium]
MSLSSAPHWRSVSVDAIAWREWNGEFVVRNERSGSTHLLGPLAGDVLRALLDAGQGLSVADIAACLDDGPKAASDSTLLAAIEEVLSEFKRLGLAEPEAQ